jgi:hypothetical protein
LPELATDFQSLPEEYQHLIRLAEQTHKIAVVPRQLLVDAESLYQDALNSAREMGAPMMETASRHRIEPLVAESRQEQHTQKSLKASLPRT